VAALSRRAHRESRELRARLDEARGPQGIVARSPAVSEVLARADLVAVPDTPVLLLGESGTGKSLLARRIHERSPRAAGPLVEVDCGALAETLLESELFGHEPGAFTGAARRRRGRFERAHRGTILLDEVAELSAGAQTKLLRVLQEGEVEPLGGERARRVDVRVVAATHRDLDALVAEGSFREDLYYRLAVFPLRLPPLRERPEDLPALAGALLDRIGARVGRRGLRLAPGALRVLARRPWPGNVRELANALERAAILSPGGEVVLPDAGLEAVARRGDGGGEPGPVPFDEGVRRLLADALRACRGKLYGPGGAAERLGLKPSTLQTKMRKHGLRRADFTSTDA